MLNRIMLAVGGASAVAAATLGATLLGVLPPAHARPSRVRVRPSDPDLSDAGDWLHPRSGHRRADGDLQGLHHCLRQARLQLA